MLTMLVSDLSKIFATLAYFPGLFFDKQIMMGKHINKCAEAEACTTTFATSQWLGKTCQKVTPKCISLRVMVGTKQTIPKRILQCHITLMQH